MSLRQLSSSDFHLQQTSFTPYRKNDPRFVRRKKKNWKVVFFFNKTQNFAYEILIGTSRFRRKCETDEQNAIVSFDSVAVAKTH